jgi:hypothetical protein
MTMQQPSTAARVFNLADVEQDIAAALKDRQPLRAPEPVDYAPPAVRAPMPDYAVHRDGVNEVGKLSAEAVVREYEAAAKEVEAMGTELKGRIEKLEATKADAVLVLDEIKEVAARYRDAGKGVFLQIEDCALMTAEVRATCGALKAKIAGPSS